MREKIVLEYPIKSSPKVLYTRLRTPGGLSEWFADDVNLRGKEYTFIWEGTEQKAEIINKKENKYIKFHWSEEDDPEAWFEFRINIDEITKDVALIVTDNVEEDEVEDATELWNSQISELKHVLGL